MELAFSILGRTPGTPLLAALDTIWILLAIAIGSAVNEWLKKRRQADKTESPPMESDLPQPRGPTTQPTRRPALSRPSATSDWEEELRRLLGGEPPVVKPPPVAPPPLRPVIIPEPKPSSPPRPVVAAPPAARTGPPPLAESRIVEAEKQVEVQLPALQESVSAYQRASHLHEGVAEHLKRVEEMTEHHLGKVPTVRRPSFSRETAQTISLIRNPRTARQAVVATLIFGMPKALERE